MAYNREIRTILLTEAGPYSTLGRATRPDHVEMAEIKEKTLKALDDKQLAGGAWVLRVEANWWPSKRTAPKIVLVDTLETFREGDLPEALQRLENAIKARTS
jgi:hypothetical protein